MGFYGDFSIEEAKSIGQKFTVICIADYGYEGTLKAGKIYEIEIVERILPMSPLCSFIGDKGNLNHAHLQRFKKIKNEEQKTP